MTRQENKNIAIPAFLLALAIFTLSQLVINSILSPLGIELQSLNSEKNYLIEENRGMEEEIAKNNSIIVIKKLASEKLSLESSGNRKVVYIESTNIIAEKR